MDGTPEYDWIEEMPNSDMNTRVLGKSFNSSCVVPIIK